MSYYNFDDHFWPAKAVCAPEKSTDSSKELPQKKSHNFVPIILASVSAAFLATTILQINNSGLNGNASINSNNGSSNCLMIKTSSQVQMRCSNWN